MNKRLRKEAEYDRLFGLADKAGKEAAAARTPTPMTVFEAGLDNKPTPGGKSWYVPSGVCGFAWVDFHPGNSALANYAKKYYGANKGYPTGVSIWVSEYGQSLEKKEAYAGAFAKVFRDAGHSRVYAGSRMD